MPFLRFTKGLFPTGLARKPAAWRPAGILHALVAECQNQWIGLLLWSAPQNKRRLALIANNGRFLVLDGWHVPNLASRFTKLCRQRLSQDWTDLC